MNDFEGLEALPDDKFWLGLRRAIYRHESELDQFNPKLQQLLTGERVNNVVRLHSFTADEMAWLTLKSRVGRSIKVYRTADRVHLAGFLWHTNRDDALACAPDLQQPHLLTGRVPPAGVLLRLQANGRKQIICYPQHVKMEKVEELRQVENA
jgi:hypothetical protein